MKQKSILASLTVFLLILTIGCSPEIIPDPTEAYIGDEVNTGTYTCVGDKCDILCSIDCNNPNSVEQVIVRVSDTNKEPEQLAIDHNGNGDLSSFKRTSDTGCATGTTILFRIPSTETYIKEQGGDVCVCNPRAGTSRDTCRLYDNSGTIPTTEAPLSAYSGLEFYSGTVARYNCDTELKINGNLIETISYHNNYPREGISSALYPIQKTSIVECVGTPIGTIYAQVYGSCGNCNPQNFIPSCENEVFLQTCEIDSSGCGNIILEQKEDFVCSGNTLIPCNDGNQCTRDTRLDGQTSCSYTEIVCDDPKSCNAGTCQCPTTGDYCPASLDTQKKCVGKDIFRCQSDSGCYKWVQQESCNEDEICI